MAGRRIPSGTGMDAYTARCLQVSSSISTPFNPYRPFRIPNHLTRSRIPIRIPGVEDQTMPGMPPELWNPPTYTVYRTSRPPVAVKQAIPIYQQDHVKNMHACHVATPPTDIEASYLESCLTPDDTFVNDKWHTSLQIDESTMNTHQCEGFGLGLDAFDNNRTPTAASYDTAKCFVYPETSAGQGFLQSGAASPDQSSLSSFSEASSGFASELPEFSTVTEYPYLGTDYSSNFEQAPLAQEATPRLSQNTFETPRPRLVAESSSRYSCRASPSTDNYSRSRSSSISSFVLSGTQRSSPYVQGDASHFSFQGLDFSAQDTSSSISSSKNPSIDGSSVNSSLFCSETHLEDNLILLPSPCQIRGCQPSSSSEPPSYGVPNVFPSDCQVEHQHEGHAPDLSGPPDLFGALREGHLLPPDKDMNPLDHDLTPREQELHFEGDIYTPRFVRGCGDKREGWCGICKPGRWLVLKNSGYWYDKSFSHGISATGTAFDSPVETRRMEGSPGVWEGLCKSCGKWIALISNKKKGTTWFRHAYKCHTRYKLKDAPKKRREGLHARERLAKVAKRTRSTPESSIGSQASNFIMTKDESDSAEEHDC